MADAKPSRPSADHRTVPAPVGPGVLRLPQKKGTTEKKINGRKVRVTEYENGDKRITHLD
jgi:hypothetical protein